MPRIASPEQNQILAALPWADRERLLPYLKVVELPLGMVLYESGDTLRHIYFPTDAIISLLYVLQDGASAEISRSRPPCQTAGDTASALRYQAGQSQR